VLPCKQAHLPESGALKLELVFSKKQTKTSFGGNAWSSLHFRKIPIKILL